MNFRIFCLGLFIVFSCTRDKNKPYDNVNIIRDEKQKKPEVKQDLKLPSIFAKSEMLLIELSQNDLVVNSWEKDSVLITKAFPEIGNENVEVYQGNNQIIIREQKIEKNQKGNIWNLTVPKFTNLVIKSENGSVLIKNINGTFNINSPVGNINLDNCSAAIQAISQSGDIKLKKLELMGRSRISTASGKVEIDSKKDLSYELTAHSGSDTLLLKLNNNKLKSNLELLTFQGEGSIYSEYKSGDIENFYSDALNRNYDLRKVQLSDSYPTSSISTGNGTILILR